MPSYDGAPTACGGRDEADIDCPPEKQRGEWVSVRAIAWMFDDAPCPAKLLPVLGAIARRCDENGRGSRQSTSTIAEKAGKSRKQAQRDIVKLRELKLIEEGDQALVAHLPKHLRPTVYDVALHIKGPKPVEEGRNPTGRVKDSEDSSDTTSLPRGGVPSKGCHPIQGTPPHPFQGDTPIPPKGVGGSLPRDTEQAFEEDFEVPLEQPSLSSSSDRDSLPAPREPDGRERDDEEDFQEPQGQAHPLAATRRLLAEHCNITDADEADEIIGYVESTYGVRTAGFWFNAAKNGSIHALVAEAQEAKVQEAKAAEQAEAQRPKGGLPHGVHEFEVDHTGRSCVHCKTPRANGRHRTANWHALAQGRNGTARQPWQPWRDPPDLSVYDQPL